MFTDKHTPTHYKNINASDSRQAFSITTTFLYNRNVGKYYVKPAVPLMTARPHSYTGEDKAHPLRLFP